ncbi:hypothetical protein [Ornithinimicrobium sp. Y1694]|uniref:hypothetical protein n=1 Tax=Ornithinimicrobium sp. Y1694 TaxID=3418590 RepID=UPI003CF8F43E
MLTAAELADRWSISTGHLANLRAEGRGLPYVRPMGGRVLYRLSDVLETEDAATVNPVVEVVA